MRIAWLRRLKRGKLKVLLVPTFSAFLSFIFIVVGPLNRLGGQYPFLVFTVLILFFFPVGNIVTQVEATFLGIIASALGLGWSNATLAIAAYCGRKYGEDSEQSNTVNGVGLALLALICGFIRSYQPRLTAASRIALFFPIFLLTANTGVISMRAGYFLDHFLITCFSAAFALIPTLIFSHHSSNAKFGSLVLGSLKTTSELLPLSLSTVLDVNLADKLAALEANRSGTQERLAKSLKGTDNQLRPILNNLRLEFRRSKIASASLEILVSKLRRLHRNPLLGPTSHVPGQRIQMALQRTYGNHSGSITPHTPRDSRKGRSRSRGTRDVLEKQRNDSPASSPIPTRHSMFMFDHQGHQRSRSVVSIPKGQDGIISASSNLVSAIQKALQSSSTELAELCEWSISSCCSEKAMGILQAKDDLEIALSELQLNLALLLNDLGTESRHSSHSADTAKHFMHSDTGDRDHFRLAFYMTALLDLAKELLELLHVVINLSKHARSSKRIFFPIIPGMSRLNAHVGSPTAEQQPEQAEDDADEVLNVLRHDDEDFERQQMDFAEATIYRTHDSLYKPVTVVEKIVALWRRAWDNTRVVQARLRLSRFLRWLKRSPHVFYAIKLAGGISLLALPAFLPRRSRGRQWFSQYRFAWAVISYMFVLETHTGAIVKVGMFRLAGTFIGALTAYICALIANNNPYALVTLATLLSIPISYLILLTQYPAIGVVSGITLPPLLFLSYLGYDNGQSSWELAWTRFVDITIGITAAIVVGSLIWPNHARVHYFRSVSITLERSSEYYLHMSRDLLRPSLVYQGNTKQYNRIEGEVRRHITLSRALVGMQRQEVSLLPRPIKLYSEIVDATERLFEALDEVRVLRFSVPRKATVFDIMPLRRELISSISMNLWALHQSFRSHSPLPQYLPSPHFALAEVMAKVEDLALSSRHRHRSADISNNDASLSANDQLGILYGMAENEAIGEVCSILEELVAAARTLFGTRTFLGVNTPPETA